MEVTTPFVVHDVQRGGRSIDSIMRPSTLRDALTALGENASARPMAGGTDLLLDLHRSGPGEAVTVVDLSGIDGFREITESIDDWQLAAGVTHNQVVMHAGLSSSSLPLAQACLEVGSPQLRNRATVAGNLVTASPANDTISALMAMGGSVELGSVTGGVMATRTVAVADFFTGFRATVLAPGELVTRINVPKLASNERGLWVKLGLRRAQAISVIHAGVVLGFDIDGSEHEIVSSARLAMGSVAATVVELDDFASALVGNRLDDETIESAVRAASNGVSPITDGRATAEYRRETVEVLLRRVLRTLRAGTQAATWPTHPPTLSTDAQLKGEGAQRGGVDVDPATPISVDVNGTTITGSRATMPLLDWVRDVAGLTGLKEGCAEGECGACTMLLDGAAVMSCLVTAAHADGREVTTIEGLDHPIQQSFVDDFAVQCGFCIPGFLMSGARLLEEVDDPDDEQIRLALSGNLCRCTGYYPIIDAVRDAAVAIRGGAS